MAAAPITDLKRTPHLSEATATSCYYRSAEVLGNAHVSAGIFFSLRQWARVEGEHQPLGSAQRPEKSLGSSDPRSWSWTNYIKHTFHIKTGISNPGQGTATWLRSGITFIRPKCETPTCFSTYVSDVSSYKKNLTVFFILWLKLWTATMGRGILPRMATDFPCD